MGIRPIAAIAVLQASACSHSRALVGYSHGVLPDDSAVRAVADDDGFEDLGRVQAKASSWIWSSCDDVAEEAMARLSQAAASLGGNAVYNAEFERGERWVKEPTCSREWGWILGVYTIVVYLTPFTHDSVVRGKAVRLTEPDRRWRSVRVTSHLEQTRECKLVSPGLGLTGGVVPQIVAQKAAVKQGANTILIQRSTDTGITGDGYACPDRGN